MRISDEMIQKAHRTCKISLICMYCAAAVMIISVIYHAYFKENETLIYITLTVYFSVAFVTYLLIERAKKLLDKKIAQTKFRWDTIDSTRTNWRNN